MDVFGQPASYTPPGSGAALPLQGVFDRAGSTMKMEGDAPVQIREVRFGARAAAFPPGEPRQNGTLAVAGAAYVIAEVRPDGLGGLTLILTARAGGAARP